MRLALLSVVIGCVAWPHTVRAQRAAGAESPPRATRSASEPSAADGRREAEKRRRMVDYVRAENFRETAERVARVNAVGTTVHVSADQQTYYMLVRRTVSSEIEVHARWDDIIIVRSGRGAIELGEATTGGRTIAGGEHRGGTLVKPSRLVVKPGDVVRVPAAVPHAFVADSAAPLELMIIKVRKAQLPLR